MIARIRTACCGLALSRRVFCPGGFIKRLTCPQNARRPCPLCSYLKHDLAWSMVCGAKFEGFACAGER